MWLWCVVHLLPSWYEVKDRRVDTTVEEQATTATVLQLITHGKTLHCNGRGRIKSNTVLAGRVKITLQVMSNKEVDYFSYFMPIHVGQGILIPSPSIYGLPTNTATSTNHTLPNLPHFVNASTCTSLIDLHSAGCSASPARGVMQYIQNCGGSGLVNVTIICTCTHYVESKLCEIAPISGTIYTLLYPSRRALEPY